MSSGKPWAGEQELQSVLNELCGHRSNIPSSKIRQVVAVANKYVTDFKMVVYEIEKFIKKSSNEDKMSGLFVLDSLCRQHSKDRETFAKRFGIRLKETISYFNKVTSKEKETIKRTVDEWKKKSIFSGDILSSLRLEGLDLSSAPSSALTSASSSSSHQDNENTVSETNRSESGARNNKTTEEPRKKQKLDENKNKSVFAMEKKETKKAVKLCPFREGSCPFGDKCRFSHTESNNLEQYAVRLSKSRKVHETYEFSQQAQFSLIQRLLAEDIDFPQQDKVDYRAPITIPAGVALPTSKSNMFGFERKKELFEVVQGAQVIDPIVYNMNKRGFDVLL